jgi:hypothetical protein
MDQCYIALFAPPVHEQYDVCAGISHQAQPLILSICPELYHLRDFRSAVQVQTRSNTSILHCLTPRVFFAEKKKKTPQKKPEKGNF